MATRCMRLALERSGLAAPIMGGTDDSRFNVGENPSLPPIRLAW